MIFEADAEQIARLTSLQLVELMKRLLHAECRLSDIPLRAATVPLQITGDLCDRYARARQMQQGRSRPCAFVLFSYCEVLLETNCLNSGRRDWTRTNDPYHVKVVL